MIGFLGLMLSLGLLMWMALRGVNIILAALICTLLVILTNGLPLAESLKDGFTFGKLGAFSFAGQFFLLFAAGAAFGRVMGESHAATSIAMTMLEKLGKERVLWITVLACAALTYGGVVVFVVIFAMYPLGLRLLKETDVPKRLLVGALALGAGTFTLTALPGTPSIHNVIPSAKLGTDLFAGAWLGLIGGAIMLDLGMWWLERERLKARAAGEGFVAGPKDVIPDLSAVEKDLPPWTFASLPLVLVIATILAPRLMTLSGLGADLPLVKFALSQPILWPSIALFLGSLLALALFPLVRREPLRVLGEGAQDSIMPLMATSVVIGFAGVVAKTASFKAFTTAIVEAGVHPLISMFAAISTISGITGSASGGLRIFMETMADAFLAKGVDPAELHRLVAMASGGFDSLPHCGAVIATLTITGLTHREAYREIGVTTVIIPVIATLVALALAILF